MTSINLPFFQVSPTITLLPQSCSQKSSIKNISISWELLRNINSQAPSYYRPESETVLWTSSPGDSDPGSSLRTKVLPTRNHQGHCHTLGAIYFGDHPNQASKLFLGTHTVQGLQPDLDNGNQKESQQSQLNSFIKTNGNHAQRSNSTSETKVVRWLFFDLTFSIPSILYTLPVSINFELVKINVLLGLHLKDKMYLLCWKLKLKLKLKPLFIIYRSLQRKLKNNF